MASLNRVSLIGRIGTDLEMRYTAGGGDGFCSFRVATTETWKDKTSGERKELTDWHRVVLYGKVAEFAKQYGSKGREVFIEGKLKTRKWQDKDGKDQYTTEVVVREYEGFKLLGPKPSASTQNSGDAGTADTKDTSYPKPDSFEFDEG